MFGGDVNKTKVEEPGATEAERNLCTAASGDICQAGITGTGDGQFGAWSIGSFIAIGPGEPQTVYVGDTGRIELFNTDGTYKADQPDPDGVIVAGGTVQSLAVDSAPSSPSFGDLYVSFFDPTSFDACCSKKGVLKLNGAGEELPGADLANLRNPRGIATDADGSVWVINPTRALEVGPPAGEVAQFDAAGHAVEKGFRQRVLYCSDWNRDGSACGIDGVALLVANSTFSDSYVNLYGPRPDPLTCPRPEVAPSINAQYANTVTDTAASLVAVVNPHFWDTTTYYVEYGTGKCSEEDCGQTQPALPARH